MKLIFTLFLPFFIFSAAVGQSKYKRYNNKNQNQQKSALNVDANKIAIFSINSEPWLRKRFENSKAYILDNNDIESINRIYKQCVRKNRIDTHYFHYRRQYVPFIDKSGKRKVWVNCFCEDSHDFSWKKHIVLVDDGGSCFFKVIINLTDSTFSNFQVNGYG